MATSRQRGFTLIELVVALGVSAVLTLLVVEALVGLARDRSSREMVIEVQGEARLGLSALERNVRTASLGAGTGVIWFQDPRAGSATFNTRISRPAIQIYDNVAGGGALLSPPAKPGTDAVLVVEALGTAAARTAAVGDQIHPATPPVLLPVTSTAAFAVNGYALFGEYSDAGWAQVTQINAGNVLQLSNTVNLFRARDSQLPAGSLVRPARARLYYVDTSDQLVRLSLAAPVPPSVATDILDREVLAQAFENLQLDCQADGGGGALAACATQADPDATAALGTSNSRVVAATAAALRVVTVSAVVHSRNPLREQQGDPAITIGGQTLAPSGTTPLGLPLVPGDAYARRAYRIEIAVRNTSLGVL